MHYKQKLLWIRKMVLDDEVLADESLGQEVFAAIRRLEPHPIRIDELNGAPADYSLNREILEEQGYSPDGESMVQPGG